MIKKYNLSPVPTIITHDLYLAAFLHSTGCSLSKVERNERKRLSFVFSGERVRELREAYREGPVKLDMRCFRDSLLHIRHVMDAELGKRSVTHVNEPSRELAAYPQQ
jgi:hypothetical protein